MSVKVSPKYQVVIPSNIREALGIEPGLEIEVIAKGKVCYLVPVKNLKTIQQELKSKLNSINLRDKKDRI